MSEHDEPSKPALDADNPPQQEGDSDKGLGTEAGAESAAGDPDQDVTEMMPDARGEVRYPPMEDPDKLRPESTPQEGKVEGDTDMSDDASGGAD